MKFKYSLLLLASIAALSACAVQGTNEVTKPGEAKSGIFGMNRVDDVKVDNDKAFTGVNKVVIASFKVGFLEAKKDSADASGIGGKSTAKTNLLGVTPQIEQAVTDAAYNDFVAKLQAAGYTVVDRAQLLADADYAKTEASPSPLHEEASMFGSANTITYVAPTGFNDIRFFIGEAGKGGGLGAIHGPYTEAAKWAKGAGIPVLSVYYTVNYANADGTVSHYAGMSNVSVGQGMSVTAGSGLRMVTSDEGGSFSNPNGNITLGQAVYSTEPFGEVINTDSGAGIAAETALNVLTTALGGGSNQTRSFDVKADPAKYQSVATDVLKQANNAIVTKMSTLK